ncbi:MAG: HD domain-containing phosphohydrolase [Fervidobacterium sp.]
MKSIVRSTAIKIYIFTASSIFIIVLTVLNYTQLDRFFATYDNIRLYFNKVNEVVVGRNGFEQLIEPMKNVKFEKIEQYKKAIQLYSEGQVGREYVLNYVKDFADFLRVYEKSEMKRIEQYSIILLFLTVVFALSLISFLPNFTKFKNYGEKIFEKIDEISKKIYIEEIPLMSPKYKEDLALNTSINEINKVLKIYKLLSHFHITSSIDDFVNNIGHLVCNLFNAERFSLALIDRDKELITAEVAFLLDRNKKPLLKVGFSQKFNETSLSKMLQEGRKYRIINDLEEHFKKTNSKSTELILKEGFKSSLTVTASINEIPFGFFFISSERKHNFSENDARLFLSISNVLSYRLYYSLATQGLLSNFGSSLVNLVEFKDNETGNHVKRVAWYSKIIASELKVTPKIERYLYLFAPLHDIGKVGIPDKILLKPGRLTEEEWEIMKKHVDYGENILKEFMENSKQMVAEDILQCMVNIVSDHHEKYDGSGYPRGKKADEISIEGRIVALADVFDALTTKRPYKEPIDFDVAIQIIKESSGKHFDPTVVNAFLSRINEVRRIYEKLKD